MNLWVVTHKSGEQVFFRGENGNVWTTLLDNADVYTDEELPSWGEKLPVTNGPPANDVYQAWVSHPVPAK